MISLEEYDRVQMILGRFGSQRPKTKTHAYSGCMKCANCGMAITAEEKKKFIKS